MIEPITVGICFGTFPPETNGGAEFVERLARSLAARGVRVTVLTSPADAPSRETLPDGTRVLRQMEAWHLSRPGVRSLRGARRALRAEGVDVVHVLFPDSVVGGRYQLAAFVNDRVPLVSTFWSLGLGRASPLPLRLGALSLIARSSVLSSHDPAYLRHLRRLAGWAKPVHWLPVGSNVHPRGAVGPPSRTAAAAEPSLLAYFGQIDPTRGVEDLLHALAALRRERDVRLVMIGSAGRPERYRADAAAQRHLERVLKLPDELGIAEAVEWTDHLPREEVAGILASASCCVLPYRRNSVGRSALAAAFASAAPVVLGGTPQSIAPLRDGHHVLASPPGDRDALAGAIARLLDDDALRDRLGEGARQAARLFGWSRIAETAISLYSEALARR